MKDNLNPDMTEKLREIPTQSLAYIGDCVYELMVRTYLLDEGALKTEKLHKRTVEYVSAKAQAKAATGLLPMLTDEEAEIYKRGRNTHTRPAPKSSTNEEYHNATALETLFGYLYLCGNTERLNELFTFCARTL